MYAQPTRELACDQVVEVHLKMVGSQSHDQLVLMFSLSNLGFVPLHGYFDAESWELKCSAAATL